MQELIGQYERIESSQWSAISSRLALVYSSLDALPDQTDGWREAFWSRGVDLRVSRGHDCWDGNVMSI